MLAFLELTRHKPQILPPATTFNYLFIIQKFLQNGGVAITFMANSQYISNTKAAIKIAYRDETGITVKDIVRLPVSIDMIQGHHAEVRCGEYTAIDLAVYTAEVLAFTTLSRVSEYMLISEDVQFVRDAGRNDSVVAAGFVAEVGGAGVVGRREYEGLLGED